MYFTTDVGKAAFFSEERGSTVLLLCDVVLGKSMQVILHLVFDKSEGVDTL